MPHEMMKGMEKQESLRDTLEDAYEEEEAKTPMSPEDFAKAMVSHHEESMRMAQAYLASGDEDATLRPLAESIIAGQQSEIDAMQEWLAGTPRSSDDGDS